MAVLSEDMIRSLTAFSAEGDPPVTSCYLDVDGRRLPTHLDVEQGFARLARRQGVTLDEHRGTGDVHQSVVEDVRRMARHVKGFRRQNGVRGLAMFSCSATGLWEVLELPVPVTSQLHVHHGPYVRPLEEILDEYERLGFLLVDRQRARMFVYELGEVADHSELLDELEREGEDSRAEFYKTRVENQREEQVHQHLRRAAGLAFDVHQRTGFDRLIVAAAPDVASELDKHLHSYLKERLIDHVQLPVTATSDEVRRAAVAWEHEAERRVEATLVAHLREEVGASGRGVAGLANTLQALNEHRVARLFVSKGYRAEGWRCPSCRILATIGRRCPACQAEMDLIDDVVEEAVEEALTQHCHVEVCVGNADLDVLGSVGALLRY